MDKINSVVANHVIVPKARFIEIDRSEINSKFPNLKFQNSSIVDNEVNLNRYTYQKILALFSNIPESSPRNILKDRFLEKKFLHNIKSNIKKVVNKKKNFNQNLKSEDDKEKTKSSVDTITDISDRKFKEKLDFDEKNCEEISKKLTENLANIKFNCSEYSEDYDTLKGEFKTLYSSFIETKISTKLGQSDEDFINVKLSANDDTYPTIEKLVAQMMNRRDLSEKFEHLY